ncbi:MAG: HEAT repeat domain-containing protein [Planctomycetota bacterium]|jgi:HEAT repeat protein|nr:HEAT repeat domain-containing protein [Planctomycetota bacterium]MDP7253821.1 HEAT repeat domain-containing protein [Planctomycetota bacterium]
MKQLVFLALFFSADVSGEALAPEVVKLLKKLRHGNKEAQAEVYKAFRNRIPTATSRTALSELASIAGTSGGSSGRTAILCIQFLVTPEDVSIAEPMIEAARSAPENAKYAADVLSKLELQKEHFELLIREMKREQRDKLVFVYASIIERRIPHADDALDAAVQLLSHKNPTLASAGMRAIARNTIKDTQGIDKLLVSALNRHQAFVARDVAAALVSVNTSPATAVSIFAKMQKKLQKDMQQAAAYGFGAFSGESPAALRETKRILASENPMQITSLLDGLNHRNAKPMADLISPVTEILQSYGAHVDSLSARYLSRHGIEAKAALPRLSQTMLNVGVRYQDDFLVALAKIQPTKECLPAIKEVLEANAGKSIAELEVQRTALNALAAMGPAAAQMLPGIRPYLQSRYQAVFLAAVRAMGSIGDAAQEDLPMLIRMEEEESKSDRVAIQNAIAAIRKAASQSTGITKTPNPVAEGEGNPGEIRLEQDPLNEFGLSSDGPLNDLVENFGHKNAVTRRQILMAIGRRGERAASAGTSIEALLKDKDIGVQKTAAWALGSIRSAGSVSALKEALTEGAIETRAAAAWALGSIGDPASVESLTKSLGSDIPRLQWMAAWALGAIGPGAKSSVAALTDAQAGADDVLSTAISEAIERIRSE